MIPRATCRAAGAAGILVTAALCWPPAAAAAPAMLRAADVQITAVSPSRCDVDLAVTFDGVPATVEHRLEVLDGATVTPAELTGAVHAGIHDVGRTRALIVRPSAPTYRVRYRVDQPEAGRFRCPLWLPTVPADGQSRNVRLAATLPQGAVPGGTMPGFVWSGGTGTVTLGHLPAFVRLPYDGAGVAAPWNLARAMDGVSLGVLLLASLAWWQRSRRGR